MLIAVTLRRRYLMVTTILGAIYGVSVSAELNCTWTATNVELTDYLQIGWPKIESLRM